MTEAYNIDCMEYMRTLPDEYFDLTVNDNSSDYSGELSFYAEDFAHQFFIFFGEGRENH